jgi:hypothetical protein
MIEFVRQGDQLFVINCTNPAPIISKDLMTDEQFDHCVEAFAKIAIERAKRPYPQRSIFDHNHLDA